MEWHYFHLSAFVFKMKLSKRFHFFFVAGGSFLCKEQQKQHRAQGDFGRTRVFERVIDPRRGICAAVWKSRRAVLKRTLILAEPGPLWIDPLRYRILYSYFSGFSLIFFFKNLLNQTSQYLELIDLLLILLCDAVVRSSRMLCKSNMEVSARQQRYITVYRCFPAGNLVCPKPFLSRWVPVPAPRRRLQEPFAPCYFGFMCAPFPHCVCDSMTPPQHSWWCLVLMTLALIGLELIQFIADTLLLSTASRLPLPLSGYPLPW